MQYWGAWDIRQALMRVKYADFYFQEAQEKTEAVNDAEGKGKDEVDEEMDIDQWELWLGNQFGLCDRLIAVVIHRICVHVFLLSITR